MNENFTLSPLIGQTSCGKFGFKVGEIGLNALHPQTGEILPTINSNSALPTDYLTGMSIKLQDDKPRVRSVNDIYTGNVTGGTNRLSYNIGYPNENGTLRTYQCLPGSAISGMDVWGSGTTGGIRFTCKNLMTGAPTYTPTYGYTNTSSTGGQKGVSCAANEVAVSMEGQFNHDSDGSSGDRMCGVQLGCRDISQELNVLRTDAGKLACCMGKLPANVCGKYLPHASGCESWMSTYCAAHPTIAECSCIKSPVAGSGKYNPICVDAKCISSGYQPQSMITARGASCPSITECNMLFDMKNNYGLINFQDASLVQKCSSGGTPTSAPKPLPAPAPPVYTPPVVASAPASHPSHTTLYLVLFFIFIVFVGIMLSVLVYTGGITPAEGMTAAVLIPGVPPF